MVPRSGWCRNPILPSPSITAAKPPARQPAVGALASGFATAELHHHPGHDLALAADRASRQHPAPRLPTGRSRHGLGDRRARSAAAAASRRADARRSGWWQAVTWRRPSSRPQTPLRGADPNRIDSRLRYKVQRVLTALEAASVPEDMDLRGFWSVRVSGNWRV